LLERGPAESWVSRLESDLHEDHPAPSLLNFWKELFDKNPDGNDAGDDDDKNGEL
jgi:hypothetical protein